MVIHATPAMQSAAQKHQQKCKRRLDVVVGKIRKHNAKSVRMRDKLKEALSKGLYCGGVGGEIQRQISELTKETEGHKKANELGITSLEPCK